MARKRRRPGSKAPSGTCEEADVDLISQLSDDILIAILSFLPLKEAACTSVLSSRWLNLWKHNPCLNFDVLSSLKNVAQNTEAPSKKRPKYVKWVNGIIRSHRALALKEFRICFRLTQSANKVIARWLEFAFARHVQILELDMSEDNIHDSRTKYCAFPEEFLTLNSGGASTSKRHSNSSRIDFKCLKVLSMKRVNVTGETIQLFLSKCSSLEKLVVGDTYKLLNVEVCGPSLVLKHLELVYCHDLKSVKVDGPSLVLKHLGLVNCHSLGFLKVSAPKLTSLVLPRVSVLLLENVPMLVDVTADCCYYKSAVKDLVPELSCCISHLEVLTLKLTDNNPQEILSTFSELPKLKKLVIKYKANAKKGLMGLTSLIRASPYLQEFVLEIMCLGYDDIFREVENTMKFPHHHLKVFEFHGYVGHSNDLQLLAYIVENCVVLDKIIINSRGMVLYCPEEFYERTRTTPGDYRLLVAAASAFMKQQLEARVPQHIELVIVYP